MGLERLRRLSMDKNKFQSIPEQALATLSNTLEELWLSVNLIETIMPESLPLPQLKSLSLDVNKVNFLIFVFKF